LTATKRKGMTPMTEVIRASLDRVEEGVLVCLSVQDERQFHLPQADYPTLRPGDVLSLTLTDGVLTEIRALPEETAALAAKNRARLRNLFRKGKG